MAEGSSSSGAGGVGTMTTLKKKKSGAGGIYTCWGMVPLDSCVTAVPENLLVTWGTVPVSARGSKKSSNNNNYDDDSSDGAGGNGSAERVLIGVVHLDTFLIHEMNTDPRKEFSSRHVHTIQLPSSLQNRCVILRARWITLKNGSVKLLLLCTNLAAYFYNEMGTKQLLKWDYESSSAGSSSSSGGGGSRAEESDLSRCSRTIAATNDFVLLGNDRGDVHLFTHDSSKGGKGSSSSPMVQLAKTLKLSSEPVAEMCAKRNGLVVVGTPTGNLSIWTGFQGEAKQPVKSTEYVLGKPEAVTGIILWYPYAIVSYGSGIIRMYNLIQKALSAQVYAHARWISAMDLCPSQNLLLTIAEDDEARIWRLKRRQKGEQRSPVNKKYFDYES